MTRRLTPHQIEMLKHIASYKGGAVPTFEANRNVDFATRTFSYRVLDALKDRKLIKTERTSGFRAYTAELTDAGRAALAQTGG